MSRADEIKRNLFENVLWGKAPPVVKLTNEGLEIGLTPEELLWQALIPALEEVGRRFEVGEFFVPEMLIAARAMQGALDILKPLLVERGIEVIGTYVMGTVKGDMHDIGKNLCNIMLEGAGFKVIDLGVNTSPGAFVAAIREHKPELMGMSAFLTTTMPMFKVTMEALEEASLRDQVKVMVGGAPVTPEYAAKVGADSYAKDASECVRVAKQLIGITAEDIPSPALGAAVGAMEKMLETAQEEA